MRTEPERFFEILKTRPVIAGVRRSAQVHEAIQAGVRILFVLGEDVFALRDSLARSRAAGCLLLAHVDLIKGVGRDEVGIRFLAREFEVDGVLTTRGNLIGPARREGLIAIQRLFVLDSESLEAGLPAVERAAPDAVEVLPGVILPLIADRLRPAGTPPVIAGGLIRTRGQVQEALRAGAVGISTSQSELWALSGAELR
jgi:glycerol uptake operon antiterminator